MLSHAGLHHNAITPKCVKAPSSASAVALCSDQSTSRARAVAPSVRKHPVRYKGGQYIKV